MAKNELNYYLLLFLLIIFTSGLAFLLMPFITIGTASAVYSVAITLGIVFGLFIIFFVINLDDLTHHHHAGIWAVVLIGSFLNFGLIFLNRTPLIGVSIPYSPANSLVTGILFAVGFYIPYLMYIFNEHKLDKHVRKSA